MNTTDNTQPPALTPGEAAHQEYGTINGVAPTIWPLIANKDQWERAAQAAISAHLAQIKGPSAEEIDHPLHRLLNEPCYGRLEAIPELRRIFAADKAAELAARDQRIAELWQEKESAWANRNRFCNEINTIGKEIIGPRIGSFKGDCVAPDAVTREIKLLLERMDKQLAAKDAEIERLRKVIASKDERCARLSDQVKNLMPEVAGLKDLVEYHENKVKALTRERGEAREHANEYKQLLQESEADCKALADAVEGLATESVDGDYEPAPSPAAVEPVRLPTKPHDWRNQGAKPPHLQQLGGIRTIKDSLTVELEVPTPRVNSCLKLVTGNPDYTSPFVDLARTLERETIALKGLVEEVESSLLLAEVWLCNCTPHIEASAETPLPLPVIRATLAKLKEASA